VARLTELERRLERALREQRGSYVQAGALFKSIRDNGSDGRPFREYVQDRWDVSVKTAYALIQASDVASSLPDDIHLPQHHAQLLFRFDQKMRMRIAKKIAPMSAREATRHVMELWDELTATESNAKRQKNPASALATLMGGVERVNAADILLVEQALGRMSAKDRRSAMRRIQNASAKLADLGT
jgi:hypothetical protein